jgi:hypothetical protein
LAAKTEMEVSGMMSRRRDPKDQLFSKMGFYAFAPLFIHTIFCVYE